MFTTGLQNVDMNEVERFNSDAASAVVAQRQASGDDGAIYSFEVYFGPNQNTFPADQYRQAFEKVIELSGIYAGAIITIEGHSDPLGYLKAKKGGQSQQFLSRMKQSAFNLSMNRAQSLAQSLISYAESMGIILDTTQFVSVGHGVMKPNVQGCTYDSNGDIDFTCAPRTEQEWNNTRRVQLQVIPMESEPEVFKPL